MLEQKLSLGKCYYKPSFFNMKIDLPIDLMDLNNLEDGAMGLYFHEYIHYLQDISTIYGLMNISTITYYIQACAHYVQKDKTSFKFKAPIDLKDIVNTEDSNDKGLINFKLRKTYIGSSISTKYRYIANFNYSIEEQKINNTEKIEKVIIHFQDTSNSERVSREFGGTHVTEGMAYLCEQYHYSSVLPKAEDYPYGIVTKLVENIAPEYNNEPLLIIALCDISLMTYHPGVSFIRLLEYVNSKNDLPNNIDDFYNECLKYIKGNHVDFEILLDKVLNELQKNFKADYYEDIIKWIEKVFQNIKILRTQLPSFIIDLIRFGEPRNNVFFSQVMARVGSPLVLNANNEGTISLPRNFNPTRINFNPGIFMAINQVLRIFYLNKPSPCQLKEYCLESRKSDPNISVDKNCDIAPWKKAKEKNLCPVGQIWHHWALKDYSPNYY